MSESKSSSGGIGFCGLLTVAFIVLKLCKVIDWSWWWVLSPAWIPAGIALMVLIILGCMALYGRLTLKSKLKKSGLNDEQIKNIVPGNTRAKSKWQQRMEQMQEAQKKREQLGKH